MSTEIPPLSHCIDIVLLTVEFYTNIETYEIPLLSETAVFFPVIHTYILHYIPYKRGTI